MDRFQEHWPDALGNVRRLDNAEYRQKTADFERTGHMQTSDGLRIYPEGYVVLSEMDVQRIAAAVAISADREIHRLQEELEKRTAERDAAQATAAEYESRWLDQKAM